jgi:hypothetical protein
MTIKVKNSIGSLKLGNNLQNVIGNLKTIVIVSTKNSLKWNLVNNIFPSLIRTDTSDNNLNTIKLSNHCFLVHVTSLSMSINYMLFASASFISHDGHGDRFSGCLDLSQTRFNIVRNYLLIISQHL